MNNNCINFLTHWVSFLFFYHKPSRVCEGVFRLAAASVFWSLKLAAWQGASWPFPSQSPCIIIIYEHSILPNVNCISTIAKKMHFGHQLVHVACHLGVTVKMSSVRGMKE
ncbi:hypothetical protein E2C01_054515 [Portunus trituberculatus]|uniref:Uncharacterized protein n=1 Tax=Portunus trituberculatus TaxID=210409 RepID=A0A5B7GJS8_PORTR|nr:hypothetical protein [Portunus trituberculatus]